MRIRTQIFLAFAILAGLGVANLVQWLNEDLKPRYRQAVEGSLVDTAVILASMLSTSAKNGAPDITGLARVLEESSRRRFEAAIYDVTKNQVDLRVYVTDASGKVLFDSHTPENVGRDFSEWRDVVLTLQGKYGARTTRDNFKDATTSVLYVSAPVEADGRIIGVVTIGKPARELNVLIDAAKERIVVRGVLTALVLALLGVILSILLSRPISKLQRYVEAMRDREPEPYPKLGTAEIQSLGEAFEGMRVALEGKGYIEEYVQSLTHELKSPVAGIQGAAELLQENPPADQQARFLDNIKRETGRIQRIVEKLLELAGVEAKRELKTSESIDLGELLEPVVADVRMRLERKGVKLEFTPKPNQIVLGDRFLLEQAVRNLLDNALDFTASGDLVKLELQRSGDELRVVIEDTGVGIPAYALDRVFDRFFSLPRPGSKNKSSGLGLLFVKEVARLHSGTFRIESINPKGVRAILSVPAAHRKD